MKEIWEPIKNVPFYEVSNLGRFRTLEHISPKGNKIHTRIITLTNKTGWYLSYQIIDNDGNKKTYRIHRLVYEAFKGEIPKGYNIHHIDGNKQNNNLSNLRLLTAKEHQKITMQEHVDYCDGMNIYNKFVRPKWIGQYSKDGKLIATFQNTKEAMRKTGVCSRNILQVASKTEYSTGHVRKQAGGYVWKFIGI